jgi:REP element-mobilizing transposase RayT
VDRNVADARGGAPPLNFTHLFIERLPSGQRGQSRGEAMFLLSSESLSTPKWFDSKAQGQRRSRATLGKGRFRIPNPNGVRQIEETRMPQSLAQIYLHIVFSTKQRTPWLQDRALRQRVHAYFVGTCKNLDSPSLRIGGVEDHVHILCRLSRQLTVADCIRELKRESSKWIKSQVPSLKDFHWQSGYGAFSVSPSHVPPLEEYIAVQEEHHRQESFQDEFRRLLRKYGIEFDERYVWDCRLGRMRLWNPVGVQVFG